MVTHPVEIGKDRSFLRIGKAAVSIANEQRLAFVSFALSSFQQGV